MEINADEKKAIRSFFAAVRKLRELNVIRTERYLGELGEFLAAKKFNLTLAESKKQKGHDTNGLDQRTQIKFHNSPTRTNIDLGQPTQYDRVIVVLGPDSKLHPKGIWDGKVVFFAFDSDHVKKEFKNEKSYSTGKKGLKNPCGSLEL
ncbi:MAG: hypothetical protein L6300_02605 [Syntrophaceae bacterium]|nr:hypothetical protein [Syntrophaceae bacterium]